MEKREKKNSRITKEKLIFFATDVIGIVELQNVFEYGDDWQAAYFHAFHERFDRLKDFE